MTAGKYVSCTRQSEFSKISLLRDEFCSLWWVADSHVRRRSAEGRLLICRKMNAYPQAGMIKCAVCGRWAPHEHYDHLCVDCRMENEHERFRRRAEGWRSGDRIEIMRVGWRRPVLVREWRAEGMPAPLAVIDCDLSIPHVDDEEKPIAEADLHGGGLEPDQTWGNAPDFRTELRRLRASFMETYTNKKGRKRARFKRHGAGCHKRLLPEDEAGLGKEIAYYMAKEKVIPSARRISNPFDRRERPLLNPGIHGLLWL